MSTLYVIGNGFDLWHRLSTRYQQFYEFAKDTLDEVGNYYSFELSVPEPWHDFENALGDYCWEHFYDFHNEVDVEDEGFRPSQLYGLASKITMPSRGAGKLPPIKCITNLAKVKHNKIIALLSK